MRGRKALAALVCFVLAAAAMAATPAGAQARGPKVRKRPGTAAPAMVTGIQASPRQGRPADVALQHLSEHPGRYGISRPERDLSLLQVRKNRELTQVRFGQRHNGVPVFGAQYVVTMESDTAHAPRSVHGHFFTELSVDPQPALSEADASRLARVWIRPLQVTSTYNHGLRVLPQGAGVLAYHLTVSGFHLGEHVRRDILIDAQAGHPLISYSGTRQADVGATGNRLIGGPAVNFTADQTGPSTYRLRDSLDNEGIGTPGTFIQTFNAKGVANPAKNEVTSTSTAFPAAATNAGAIDAHWGARKVFDYYLSNFGRASIDDAGMKIESVVNIHPGFFGDINAAWDPLANQMQYSNTSGTSGLQPQMSASLDIVAHEITHGVIEFAVPADGLIYINQSGAVNEALADYFGEAIQLWAENGANSQMNDPDAGEIGEDICIGPNSTPPDMCPFLRDMAAAQPLTTDDYIFLPLDVDSGGVHVNSPIFSGAVWQFRQALWDAAAPAERDLAAARADRYVYDALHAMTPLDGFIDGRAILEQTISAADEPTEAADLSALQTAFDARGITAGWDTSASGTGDGATLWADVLPFGFQFNAHQVRGDRYVIQNYADLTDAYEPPEIWVGRLGNPSARTKVAESSPTSNRSDETPDISGRRVTWSRFRIRPNGIPAEADLMLKTLGGRSRILVGRRDRSTIHFNPSIEGNRVGWEKLPLFGDSDVLTRTLSGKTRSVLPRDQREQILPQVLGNWVVWYDFPQGYAGKPRIGMRNMKTRARPVYIRPPRGGYVGPAGVADGKIYFLRETRPIDGYWSVAKARLGRTRISTLFRESASTAPVWAGFTSLDPPMPTATRTKVAWHDEYCVVFAFEPGTGCDAHRYGRDLWKSPASGGRPRLVTQNRGDQAFPGFGSNSRLVWLDTSRARTDVRMKRV